MTHRFIIRGRLPGLNEMTREARGNKFDSARTKREVTTMCAAEARIQKVPVMTRPVEIEIMWVEPNMRRDLDNIAAGAKYVLDGLQRAGVLKNDGWADVTGLVHHFAIDKNHPRVEVQLHEVDP